MNVLFKSFRKGVAFGLGLAFALASVLGLTILTAQSIASFSEGDVVSAKLINDNFTYLNGQVTSLINKVASPLPGTSSGRVDQDMAGFATLTDVSGLTVTITSSGSPVWVGLQSQDPGSGGIIQITGNGGNGCTGEVAILRNGVIVTRFRPAFSHTFIGDRLSIYFPHSSIWYIDRPAAGTHTYKIQARSISGCAQVFFHNAQMIAMRFNEQ